MRKTLILMIPMFVLLEATLLWAAPAPPTNFSVVSPECMASSLNPISNPSVPSTQTDASINLAAGTPSCTWTATSKNLSWLTIQGAANGTGSATISYRVLANTTSTSRSGSIFLQGPGKTFHVTQAGATSVPGAYLWSLRIGGSTTADLAYGTAVALDPRDDSVIIVGRMKMSVDFGNGSKTGPGGDDIFLAKYSAAGRYIWARVIGSAGTSVDANDGAKGVAVDGNGNIWVTGYCNRTMQVDGWTVTNNGGIDIFIAKFSPGGTCLYAKGYGGTGSDVGNAIALDGAGNVFVTGVFGYGGTGIDFGHGILNSLGNQDIFLAKFGPTGTNLWANRYGDSDTDFASAVAVDSGGDVVITGYFHNSVDFGSGNKTNSLGGADIFLAKYSGVNGNNQWSNSFGNSLDQWGYGVAVDRTSGDVVITGSCNGSVNFGGEDLASNSPQPSIILARFSALGQHRWSKSWGIAFSNAEIGQGVALDGGGNVILTGSIVSNEDFGGGALITPGAFGYNVFVAKFLPNGDHVWSKSAGGISTDHGNAVAVDRGNNVHLTGDFQSTISFGDSSYTAPTSAVNAFLVKYGP